MGAITVRRAVVGKMGALVFVLGVFGFLISFFEPGFYPMAWISLFGGLVIALFLRAKHRRSSHPTVSHLEPDVEERRPIEPR